MDYRFEIVEKLIIKEDFNYKNVLLTVSLIVMPTGIKTIAIAGNGYIQ